MNYNYKKIERIFNEEYCGKITVANLSEKYSCSMDDFFARYLQERSLKGLDTGLIHKHIHD